MSKVYIKDEVSGNLIEASFDEIISKDWDDKLIVVKVGSDMHPATPPEVMKVFDELEDADALDDLKDASFLVTSHSMDFEVLGNVNEIANKNILIKVTGEDNLSKLGELEKDARAALKPLVKKVYMMPAPITVDEYKELMEIKRRRDIVKNRRG